jgi:hypothetical protein
MKRLIILGLTILLACSLTACKSPSEAIGEKIGEKILEEALGSDVDVDGDKVTIKGEDGTSLELGSTEWPNDKLGKELPKMTKGKVTYVANSEELCMIMLEEVKKSAFEDYLDTVKKDGFTQNEFNYSDATLTSYTANNGKGLNIQLTYDSETEEVSITVAKEKQ